MTTGMSLALLASKMPCQKSRQDEQCRGQKATDTHLSTGEAREVGHSLPSGRRGLVAAPGMSGTDVVLQPGDLLLSETGSALSPEFMVYSF